MMCLVCTGVSGVIAMVGGVYHKVLDCEFESGLNFNNGELCDLTMFLTLDPPPPWF